MSNELKLTRPTPRELTSRFKLLNQCDAPSANKTYKCDTPSPIRAVAEYEEMGGVVISYIGTLTPQSDHIQLPPYGPRTFGIPNDLIIKMQQLDESEKEPVHIFIFCADKNEKDNIIQSLKETAIEKKLSFDPELIHLIPWDTDTYWTRDFSPWWVKFKDKENSEESERYAISKHIYTTLGGGSVGMVGGAEEVNPREGSGIFRCNDDYGAVKISDFLNAPIRKWNKSQWSAEKKLEQIPVHNWFFSGLLNVGGNYMVTRDGVIASSYLVATQNELPTDTEPESKEPSPETLDNRMKYIMEQTNRFLGANTYHVLTDPTGTYIGHIDCWAKFLDDKKIIIAESENKEINEAFNKIEEFFKNLDFEVYRVMCQDICVFTEEGVETTTAPYTNSLILNNYVYVPLAGKGYEEYDRAAIKAYENAYRDKNGVLTHNIIGVIGKTETPWLGTDALHCRTNAIPRTVVNNWLIGMGKKDKKTKQEEDTKK